MVRYKKPVEQTSRIEDRRGSPGRRRAGGIAAGGGGFALLIAIVIALLGGGSGLESLGPILEGLEPAGPAAPSGGSAAPLDPASDPDADLFAYMSAVFTDAETVWRDLFSSAELDYRDSRLVIFEDATQSSCGGAVEQIGPHYCPLDETVYLDLDFFDQLSRQFGATGDFAPAYVVAHEVAHHVQNVLGISDQVRDAQQQDPSQANAISIRLELQADCFAGVWASTLFVDPTQSDAVGGEGLIELDPGEVVEALEAAAAVGDDRIQQTTTGRIDPEKFNHGTSAQRQEWFDRGYQSGDPNQCDTFSANL